MVVRVRHDRRMVNAWCNIRRRAAATFYYRDDCSAAIVVHTCSLTSSHCHVSPSTTPYSSTVATRYRSITTERDIHALSSRKASLPFATVGQEPAVSASSLTTGDRASAVELKNGNERKGHFDFQSSYRWVSSTYSLQTIPTRWDLAMQETSVVERMSYLSIGTLSKRNLAKPIQAQNAYKDYLHAAS